MIYQTLEDAKIEPQKGGKKLEIVYQIIIDGRTEGYATNFNGALDFGDSVRLPGQCVVYRQHKC